VRILDLIGPVVLIDIFPQYLVRLGVGTLSPLTERVFHLVGCSVLSFFNGDDSFVIRCFRFRILFNPLIIYLGVKANPLGKLSEDFIPLFRFSKASMLLWFLVRLYVFRTSGITEVK